MYSFKLDVSLDLMGRLIMRSHRRMHPITVPSLLGIDLTYWTPIATKIRQYDKAWVTMEGSPMTPAESELLERKGIIFRAQKKIPTDDPNFPSWHLMVKMRREQPDHGDNE